MIDDEISKRRKQRAAAAPEDPLAMFKDAVTKAMKMAADQRSEEKRLRREVGRIADALTSMAADVRRAQKRADRRVT